jgi:hypothetical protein
LVPVGQELRDLLGLILMPQKVVVVAVGLEYL